MGAGISRHRLPGLLALGLAGTLLAGACSAGLPDGSPSDSLAPVDTATPAATSTAAARTPTPAPNQSGAPWPAGWDDALCAAFPDVVLAQELARDIGRALAEDDRDDAIGLAHDLTTTAEQATAALATLPEWPDATDLLTALTAMLEEDTRLASSYLRYLEEERDVALDRAHESEIVLRDSAVPAVLNALAPLIVQGLSCPASPLRLETP